MSEFRGIEADFSNWRTVAGRKVLQLIFEVPIEQTAYVMQMLGVPMPGESKWCAIALLENGKCADERNAGSQKTTQKLSEDFEQSESLTGNERNRINALTAETGTSPTEKPKDRKRFSDLPLSQQSAIRCADKRFQEFLVEVSYALQPTEAEAIDAVRASCGVRSRSEIDGNPSAAEMWRLMESNFQDYLTNLKYAGSAR